MTSSDPGKDLAPIDGSANAGTLPCAAPLAQPWADELPPLPWQIAEMSAPPPPNQIAWEAYAPAPRRSMLLLLLAFPLVLLLILSAIGLALMSTHHLLNIQIVSSESQEAGVNSTNLGASSPDIAVISFTARPMHPIHQVSGNGKTQGNPHDVKLVTPTPSPVASTSAALTPTPGLPVLSITPSQLVLTCDVQPGAPMQPASTAAAGATNFVITNAGDGTLAWKVSTTTEYQFSQASGVLAAGQSQAIDVSAITQSGSITIDAGDALDARQTITVQSC